MKTLFVNIVLFGCVSSLLSATSCCDHNEIIKDRDIVTRGIEATEADSAYTGLLEVYPCIDTTSIYFGNYTANNTLFVFNAYYQMLNGVPDMSAINYPVKLPLGEYTLVYWGFPTLYTTDTGQQIPPAIDIGVDLKEQYYKLRPMLTNSSVCHPSNEITYGIQRLRIGSNSLFADMQRVSSMLNVYVMNIDNSKMSSFNKIDIQIGTIANRINAFTAQPSDFTSTIATSMTINNDSTQWSASRISLFPSLANPMMTIIVTLTNGTVKTFSQRLASTLSSGTATTVQIYIGTTLSTENSTRPFSIAKWIEQTDTIQIPNW